MWIVEAKTFGDDPQYYRYGPVSEKESRRIHKELANSGEWALVHSWSLDAEKEQQESDARINAYFQSLEDGIGEGQP